MTAILGMLLFLAPVLESFDAPLDPARWYVGAPNKPKSGRLRLPKGGWVVARGVPHEGMQRLEVRFRHKGGNLEIEFFKEQEPLTRPSGAPIVIKKAKGDRVFVLSPIGARVDGEPIEWKGEARGTFRLRALRGAVEIDEVKVTPSPPPQPEPSRLERDTLFLLTTPPAYHDGEKACRRSTLALWDVEVAFLLRRGAPGVKPVRGEGKGAPVLAYVVAVSDGRETAAKAGAHELAMADWGDERGNLSAAAYRSYLASEYAQFELLMDVQRVMNAALPEKKRRAAEPLVALAAIRHSANCRAALALAETLGMKKSVALVRKHLGAGGGRRRVSSDRVRAAAAAAARAVLGQAPKEWPGFEFDPQSRPVTLQQARELLR
ncbi:MAG: hypothetical protein ACYTGZ_04995 [Planctomycetota bacterium]|jgi:hypothetical protein